MSKGRRLVDTPYEPPQQGVLLKKGGAKGVSDVFTVVDKPIRVLVFGLKDPAERVQVLRVWKPASTGGWDSCGEMLPGGEVLEMPYKISCHNVALSTDVTELAIDAEGDYRVVYTGPHRVDVQVVYYVDGVVRPTDSVRGIRCYGGAP